MIALFTTPVVAGVTCTGQCSGQTVQLTDQFSLPHQFYDSFVLASAVVKPPNLLISFHCPISFMIALFTTPVVAGVTGIGQGGGQTAQLADQLSLPHHSYDSFVYNNNSF